MSDLYLAIAIVALAYFLGSIPTGVLFARRRGVDLRKTGSGNIGATNVARTVGKKLGLVVLVLDALKGAVPLLLLFALDLDEKVDPLLITFTGFFVICGHCFSIWLGFRGGKGVATTLGVFLVVAPLDIGIAACVFAVVAGATRIVAIGSLAAAVALPASLWIRGGSDELVTLAIATALVVIVQHRSNIARLIARDDSEKPATTTGANGAAP